MPAINASTSAFDIGVGAEDAGAAGAAAAVLAGAPPDAGALGAGALAAGAAGAGAAGFACALDPKIADTMLPKMLIAPPPGFVEQRKPSFAPEQEAAP